VRFVTALTLLLLLESAAVVGLLSAADADTSATSTASSSSSALCATITSSYVIKSGDTPKKIIKAAYPDSNVPWRKLWSLVRTCNAKAAASGKPSQLQLIDGTSLSIPAVPARLINAYDKPNNKPDDKDDPVLQKLCGCTPEITVSVISSWLDVVAVNYPDVKPAEFAANILAMCNRGAKFVDASDKGVKLLAKDQILRGICITLNGKSFEQFLNDAHAHSEALQAEIAASKAKSEAEAEAPAAAALVADEGVSVAQAMCTINTGTSTSPVRPVYLANVCPVYTNG
jgi:hypothetical protein